MQSKWWVLISGCLIVLSGCSGKVKTSENLSPVSVGSTQTPSSSAPCDPSVVEAEDAISDQCVVAWRKALAGDESGAMKQLRQLDAKYPQAITVRFMMGQVEEHMGKKKEAVQYYQQSVRQARTNSMYLFKLAQSLATAGDAKGASANYRALISINPDFVPARVGLAESLWDLDKDSREARQQLAQALKLDPKSNNALQLQQKMKASRAAGRQQNVVK